MVFRDYYRLLGVEREASGEEIKKAYRKLAMEYHPDRNQNKPGCEERLKEVNEAYQVLGDEEKRQRYDRFFRQYLNRNMLFQGDLSDDLIEKLRELTRAGFVMRGFCWSKGMGFGKRVCRRWKAF